MKIYKADVFIVPNGIFSRESDSESHWNYFCESANHRFEKMHSTERIRDLDKIVQVWVTSESSENWGDHQLPFELQEDLGIAPGERCYFQDLIPVRWVEGLKEGESFRLYLEGKEGAIAVDLTLNQKAYRYRDRGNFEDCLKKLLEYHDRKAA